MVASTLTQQQTQRGWFDVLDDSILNATALSLWDLVWTTSFSHCLSCNWWIQLTGTTFVTSPGTPTGWRLLTLRVLIFLQQQCQLLLTLWVILFFYFGVLSLKGISSGGSNLGDSGTFVALHGVPSLLSVLCSGSLNLLV